MENPELFFAKLEGVCNNSYNIKYIPCLIGSERNLSTLCKKLQIDPESKSINIPIEKVSITCKGIKQEIVKEQISHKLIVGTCTSISDVHAIINYCTENPNTDDEDKSLDYNEEGFYIKTISPMYINNKLITKAHGYQRLNQYDSIYFPCESCIIPHLFNLILPIRTLSQSQMSKQQNSTSLNKNSYLKDEKSIKSRQIAQSKSSQFDPRSKASVGYSGQFGEDWSNIEKDGLK